MRKKFLATLGCILITISATAHTRVNPFIQDKWGGVLRWITCNENNTQGCIGKELRQANCSARDAKLKVTHGYAYLFMLAREINHYGAYFCPTQFQRNSGNSTTFAEPLGNSTCVWLCREGFTGDECKTKVEDFNGACDVTPFLRDNYDNVKHNAAWSNIEWSFPYFAADGRAHCKSTSGSYSWSTEHDILLAIDKFLPSGNGAIVRQMEFSARYDGKTKEADLQVYPANASTEILVCKRGYKPNAGRTDCEPINPTECNRAILSQKMCSGWDLSQYDENIHTVELANDCYKYKCKRAGYTFASTTDHTCVECTTNMRGGAHPTDGTCVKCETGYVFDKTAHEEKYCVKAIGLTQIDLTLGRNKTKANYKDATDVKQQCWTKASPEEYRKCVMGE